jgi:hypothetical protein
LLLESLSGAWPDLSLAERQRLLASAIDVVYVRRTKGGRKGNIADRVKLVWRGENPHELSGPGRSVPVRTFDW